MSVIKDFMNKLIDAKLDRSILEDNGKIIRYCNGNDSTDFDAKYNGRCCEFKVRYDKATRDGQPCPHGSTPTDISRP